MLTPHGRPELTQRLQQQIKPLNSHNPQAIFIYMVSEVVKEQRNRPRRSGKAAQAWESKMFKTAPVTWYGDPQVPKD